MNVNATPRKRPAPGEPGSTPFSSSKFQSSLVPMNRPTPSRSYHPPKNKTRPTGFSSNTRDIFRTSSTPQPNRASTFSPDLPAVATKATPSARKFVPQKSMGAGMSSAASADPFKIRIPSPDPELTGEALAKQVPDDPNRAGTVYADQYLAHKCPPHFDELQRRQFFCILDLRRLKYAANEIFVKKDWKLNILNFAKEYEKSRGLILLRYGLYEFKKVKPSAEVLKRWRAAHGLPDEEPEDKETESNGAISSPRPAGTATKRKADDEAGPKDNALTASTANQNKRRNVEQETPKPIFSGPAPFKKSKRKADETGEPDENQPNKLQKQPASAAVARFSDMLDKVQKTPGSPTKRPALATAAQTTLFGTPKASAPQSTGTALKPNPFATSSSVPQSSSSLFDIKPTNGSGPNESVLAGHKPGSTLSANAGMFGYLSGSSANTSGNEKEDAEDEAESESESEQEAESQSAAPSYEPSAAASTGTSTPPAQNGASRFSSSKFGGTTSTPFGNSLLNKPAEPAMKGGLFDRVKLGADGQPMRATPSSEGKEEKETPAPAPEVSTPVAEPNKTPAKTPGDFRFDPTTTPISFGQPSTTPATAKPSLFPAATAPETPKEQPQAEDAPATKPSSIFAPTTQTTSTPATAPPKPLFGEANKAANIFQPKPSENASPLFGVQKPAEQKSTDAPNQPNKPAFGSIFGAKTEPTTSAPQEKPKSLFNPSSTAPAASIFGTPTETGPTRPGLFGASPDVTPAFVKQAQSQTTPGLFGASPNVNTAVSQQQAQLFNTLAAQDPAKNLFDAGPASNTPLFQNSKRSFEDKEKSNEREASEPSAKKPSFGGEKNSGTPNFFGANPNANIQASSAGFVFGSANNQPPSNSIFNSQPEATNGTSGTTQGAKSIFSTSFNPPSVSDTPKPATPSFSFTASQPAPTEQKQNGSMSTSNMFGNSTATSGPSFEFKAPSPAPAASNISGRKIATPRRRLGTPGAQTPNTSFNAGAGSQTPSASFNASVPASQPQPSTGFSFGTNNSGPRPVAASFGGENSNGGFNFTFGGNGQSASNPFNASNGQASAPLFGNNASTTPSTTPFGSFDQPKPPTPAPSSQGAGIFSGLSNGANAAPSINFHPPTPSQNAPSIFAPKPTGLFGNNLQPSGDGTMGASSPMPAPSSLGTTPVNGTPEPQTQNEDGEEAPQEQISLTEGGPGEEDEDILHEVRAKAIKYVPVTQGDEGEKTGSPWRTQGVGPLRILKNKTTGSVRILLRAEPRGHIAMNKAVLPDIEYKAKDKTINFATANDTGSGLETWVLQVKKPEFAQELASIMEANKAANKK